MDMTPKIPDPVHPITVEANDRTVTARLAGKVIAKSERTLNLREATYPKVIYFPQQDCDVSLFVKSDHTTFCPYKGECSYFSIPIGGDRSLNAIWSYENPYESVRKIAGYLAFYPNRIDSLTEN